MKKYYEKTYPVKNVVFNESFKRKIEDPNYNADYDKDFYDSDGQSKEDEEDNMRFDNYFEPQNAYAQQFEAPNTERGAATDRQLITDGDKESSI